MTELLGLTCGEMRTGLLGREFSAVELTKAHLEHSKATNERYNSFITICEDSALAAAAHADILIKEQGTASPELSGIPVALKDNLVTQDIETTCGSKILKGFIPPYDATAVSRLKKAGAVIIGKTNMDEFGMGSSSERSAFGPVRNPWDTERVPGGSSGGSAVAVATGQSALALGTDTGGSIRQPAAMVGVYGLKPTYGRVSRYGAVAYASSLDQIGPFARNVPDLALIFSAIAGKDPRDSTSMDMPAVDYLSELKAQEASGLRGVRIGKPAEYLVDGLEPEVLEAYRASLAALSALGAEIVDISLPHSEFALATYYIICQAEAASNLARYDGVRYGYRSPNGGSLTEMYEKTRAEGFGAEVKRRIMMGNYVLSAGYYDAYYRKAQQVRTLIINDFKAAFANHCSMIATPISPTTAFKIGEKTTSPLTMFLADIFTVPINLAGLPAVAIPCGNSPTNGMPIGLQLIGPPFAESSLLGAAAAFSAEKPVDGFLVSSRR